ASRRRHTRSKRDWSSDVCSSDLNWGGGRVGHTQHAFAFDNHIAKQEQQKLDRKYPNAKICHLNRKYKKNHPIDFPVFDDDEYRRSEERRVGKVSIASKRSLVTTH